MTFLLQSVSDWFVRLSGASQEEKVEMIGEYDLIHVGQKHNWDCGIACLEMCLKWWRMDGIQGIGGIQGMDGSELLPGGLNVIEYDDKKSPLWTIDIFISLHQNGVDGAVMYTTCKGVHPGHYSNSWYNDHIDADASRVNEKFLRADKFGLIVHEETISMQSICEALQSGLSAAIILVDNHRMQSYSIPNTDKYAGHYIFLLDFDPSTDEVRFLDPSRDSGVKYVSSSILDGARSQPGTDRDIILIRKGVKQTVREKFKP